jgi:hypothetical protein
LRNNGLIETKTATAGGGRQQYRGAALFRKN